MSKVLKTGIDELYELIKSKNRASIADIAKTLGMSEDTVQALVDFLVEEKILDIEYKFTTPYVYLSKDKPKQKVLKKNPKKPETITKEEFFKRAQVQGLPTQRTYDLWNKYLEQHLHTIKQDFYQKAKGKGIPTERTGMLWSKYLKHLT